MKLKITKDEYEKLPEAMQGEYTEDADGYKLNVEGLEDTGALKRAKDHEKEARKAAEIKARELEEATAKLQEQIDALKDDGSRKAGDIEALEKSYKDKLAKAEEVRLQAEEKFTKALKKITVDAATSRIATELAGDKADILIPHISRHIGFEMVGDEPIVRVLDSEGKPSSETLDELKEKFFTNDLFAPIITGSKASGGGTAGGKHSSGSPTAKKLGDMTATEEAKFANENPEAYKKMIGATT